MKTQIVFFNSAEDLEEPGLPRLFQKHRFKGFSVLSHWQSNLYTSLSFCLDSNKMQRWNIWKCSESLLICSRNRTKYKFSSLFRWPIGASQLTWHKGSILFPFLVNDTVLPHISTALLSKAWCNSPPPSLVTRTSCSLFAFFQICALYWVRVG